MFKLSVLSFCPGYDSDHQIHKSYTLMFVENEPLNPNQWLFSLIYGIKRPQNMKKEEKSLKLLKKYVKVRFYAVFRLFRPCSCKKSFCKCKIWNPWTISDRKHTVILLFLPFSRLKKSVWKKDILKLQILRMLVHAASFGPFLWCW